MDSKSAIIAICFFVTYVQALQEQTGEQVFSIAGINEFRRHSHIDIDCTDPKIAVDKTELLKKYLTLKSRQQSEFFDLVAKKSHGKSLPLQNSYLEIMKVLYEAKNMHYDGLNCAIKSKTICLPWSSRNLKNPINLPQDEDYPGDPRYKSDCNRIRLEQHIELANIKIEGLLTNEIYKRELYFSITFFSPKMEASYLRILTKAQGYLTKSFTEDLTMAGIILNITNQGVSEVFDMSGNTEILQKVAQVWMAPVVDAIKNQHTYIEVLQQSETLSSTYVGEVFQRLVDQVEFIITKGYLSVSYPEYFQFLGRLHVAHYESLIDLNDTSCGHQIFTHSFHIKFKRRELSAAGEEGDEAIHGFAKELSLKFEIDTNKFGEPLTKTKKYQVDLKLDVSYGPRDKNKILMLQKVISLSLTGSFQERINDLFF